MPEIERKEGDAARVALLDLTYQELEEFVLRLGEPHYRVDQIAEGLYKHLSTDFHQMHPLPQTLRQKLRETATIGRLTPVREQISQDGLTRKVLFALEDNETVESVLMHYYKRHTICLSTQVGCPVGCPFCATGQSGLTRNLTSGEIGDQVLHFARVLRDNGHQVTNAVFMGMGEPFLNYDATWKAIRTLAHPKCFNLGARRMTISSVGIIPGIKRMSEEDLQVGLAVSLHAANDDLRDKLVPINRRYPLAPLIAACKEYTDKTGRRITFEYALIEGVNDSTEQAKQLSTLLEGLLCHVNLISLNPIPGSTWQGTPREKVLTFRRELLAGGVPATVRLRRGLDIQAGCGQLRSA